MLVHEHVCLRDGTQTHHTNPGFEWIMSVMAVVKRVTSVEKDVVTA
jgi:hypothetical protein